jgi:hypothetical protein
MASPLTILIVNFNSGTHLGVCLRSIADCAISGKVVVIDNASGDGSERAAEGRPSVSLVRNPANVGFARAVNQGLAMSSEPLVMLLNPDCVLRPGVVPALETELDAHPRCAIAAPAILNEDGTIQGSVRGDPTIWTGLFGRSTLLTRLFPGSRLARQNVRTSGSGLAAEGGAASVDADWVSGACLLARRKALEAVGGFDERYFLYWEDADLCRRLRQRGYTMRYVPSARVVHGVGGSSQSAPGLAIRAFHQSAYTYYATHVARGPLGRAVARLLLAGRCRWKLLTQWVTRA